MSYGFYFDMNTCIGCRTCQVACKDKNDLPVGTLFRQVRTFETGEFPTAKFYHFSSTCNHCEIPACVTACPQGALTKDEETGAVLHDDGVCIGCQMCVEACPYSVPQYIEELGVVHKCDMCYDLIQSGENPTCVDACIMRCLEWGDFDELKAAHGDAVVEIACLPEDQTGPHTIIEPKDAALEADFIQKCF